MRAEWLADVQFEPAGAKWNTSFELQDKDNGWLPWKSEASLAAQSSQSASLGNTNTQGNSGDNAGTVFPEREATGEEKPRIYLQVLSNSFQFEKWKTQWVDALPSCDGVFTITSTPSKADKQNVRVLKSTLHVRNTSDQTITAITFDASYSQPDGTPIDPAIGLRKWDECAAAESCGFVRSPSIQTRIAPGAEGTLTLRDLMSERVFQLVKGGKCQVNVWAVQTEITP